jgi:hypothetical protein
MTVFKRSFLTLFILFFLVACKSEPILNINDGVFDLPRDEPLHKVTQSIKRAGNGLGWKMKVIEPGKIVGILFLRTHMAKIEIDYDTRNYTIKYLDSENLHYQDAESSEDGEAHIHSNYNGWIQNLNNAIQAQAFSI